ncbi:hypothetical protein POSPLADRAFT_1102230, partial [Postia placenta MAD-698-R-SB12]
QGLLREVESLHITVQNQQALVDSYKRQVDALPASTGSGHSRQPKIGEPPAFKGSEDKTKLEEWLDLIVLWKGSGHLKGICGGTGPDIRAMRRQGGCKEGDHGDRRRAPLGPDTPLFGTRIPPGTSTQSPNRSISPSTLFDTFDGARRLLEARHGLPEASRSFPIKYRTSRHAFTTATGPKWPYVTLHLRVRHDVTLPMDLVVSTVLFINKDLASKDFVKYAERFRTLGRLTEYDNSLLIDKLREVIPRDMRLVLAGKDESTLPKDWTLFLDILLNINKIVNPEKARGLVFKNSGSDNGSAVPMDIDSAEKSKSKGKGKGKAKDAEAASTEAKKYCVICKSKTHNTDDCYKLAKNADKRPKTQGDGARKAQGGSGNPAAKKAKKTRVIQVELTDSEDDTPLSTKAVSANTARIEEIANVEESTLAGKDEPQLSAKTEPTTATSDFWKKYM